MPESSGNKAKFRVAVCGGGISGLALAAFLSKAEDIAVDVFEVKSEVRTIGAGIAIWQCYWDLLKDTVGLEAKCSAKGIPAPKADNPANVYEFFQMDISPMVVPRTMLLESLLEETTGGSCSIHTDKRLIGYSSNEDATVTLSFADGGSAVADLLIGADGVHSQVRETMFRDVPTLAQPVFSGQLATRLKCRAEDLPAEHPAHSRFLIWCGDGRFVTSNMVGEFVQMTAYDHVPVPSNGKFWDDWVKQVSVDTVSQLYTGWDPTLLSLLQASREASQWAIHTVGPLPQFVSGNVALVGDAAHAMTPHIGLGGGQGIHDAFVLSHILTKPSIDRSTLTTALSVYDRVRRPASQRIAQWSLECGLMYGFLLPKKREQPPASLAKEFYMRTDWLRNKNVLDSELELVQNELKKALQAQDECS
ncbi:FAD-dependent oxidoreductase [Aspergillus tanneri]|uniref:FAD-binding domain-containing protein n=1 Tax=Aspergillus tanneri TaxID=1220188 RepID=A0A5M9MDY8_9EURO|nr:uncharacterized protein ATNIH1004_009405 [Aspergillus tanneri]KAA8645188.1 hypothetical protein ATNIH1004_009405 [Aspergillus tanneri]